MDNRSIQETNEWNYYSIVLDILKQITSIHFGVLLIGKEKVWVDGFHFEEVVEKISIMNMLK